MDFSTFVYMDRGEIIIYQTADGETCLDVRMENDSVWLTQAQMVELFNSTKQNVSLHINNLFKEGELEREATVKEYLIVQQEGHRSVKRKITAYNLDVIISVGYRVKSQRGTQFRIWANKVLKEYLIKGYAVNSQAKIEQLEELKQTVRLLSNVLATKDITRSEAVGLLRVITDYTYGLDTLDRYDYQQLEVSATTTEEPFHATYENAMEALQVLRDKFGGSELFAHEKDESFKSTMGAIYQTFGGHDLYPSVEEKAANLLYLTVKNHSFSDGNKRIAAFLFLWFGEQSDSLPCRRFAPLGQQYAGRSDTDDRRKPHGGKGRDDEGCGEPDKQEQLGFFVWVSFLLRLCRVGVLILGCHPINFRSLLSVVFENRRRRCS